LPSAFGSSEVVHVLATQTLRQAKPAAMRIQFEGVLAPGITAKDLILHTIGKLGMAGGRGHAVEYAGAAIRAMEIEARLTICNLSIEFGAKMGLIAPDDRTFELCCLASLGAQGRRAREKPSRAGGVCRATMTRPWRRTYRRCQQGCTADYLGNEPARRHRSDRTGP